MLRIIGKEPIKLKKIISEIYKTNARLLSRLIEVTRQKEIDICREESQIILNGYDHLLAESSKVVLDNIYNEVEKTLYKLIPSFKYNVDFMLSLLKTEIDVESEITFSDVYVSSGSEEFCDVYRDIFNVDFDSELEENILIFRYKEIIKTIDFSSLSENIIRDIKSCRIKHLSMIDAIRMKT